MDPMLIQQESSTITNRMQFKTIQVELRGVAKLCICAALTKFKKVTISCFGRDQSVLQWLPFSRGEISMCNIIGDELLLNFGAKFQR